MRKVTKQKRRKMEKKRRKDRQDRKAAKAPPLAYYGNKYKKDKYVPIMLVTETAIYETHAITDKNLTDENVWDILAEMIARLRKGALPELPSLSGEEQYVFDVDDFMMMNIQGHWQAYFEDHEAIGRDSLIGVLRTILGSIEVHSSHSHGSTGYLDFLADFLKRAGVNVERIFMDEYERLRMGSGA
ncbi:MAG: hypothetical protein JXM70_11885 [Pirellulales bacterium]|nr:hypothetical protein [Pirellulales bacterium]